VLGPIFEADLQPEQYAYRADRSASRALLTVSACRPAWVYKPAARAAVDTFGWLLCDGLSFEAADSCLLSLELAAATRRVMGVRRIGVRVGNWLTADHSKRLLAGADRNSLRCSQRNYSRRRLGTARRRHLPMSSLAGSTFGLRFQTNPGAPFSFPLLLR
jgi:hypothetical protein